MQKQVKKRRKPNRRNYLFKYMQSATVVALAAIVLFFTFAFPLVEKQEFSEGENRYLEKFPEFTFEALREGKYTEKLQSYLSDHFPMRDFFMGLKAETEIALGKKEIGGVYIGKDGYLIEDYAAPKNTDKVVGQFEKFAESVENAEVSLMLVPTAITVYKEKLPALAPTRSQLETREEIYGRLSFPVIDCYDELMEAKKDNQLYYCTDHHWTSYGAYAAYTAYCGEKGITPLPAEQFEIREVSSDFKGTIYSKLNDAKIEGDTITIFENPENRLTVYYEDTKETADSLYNFEYLDKKDKYSMFLNNIHPLIEITNETADSNRELAVIKDSYANCLVPFLVNHYRKVYVFDTRYYKGGPSSFINENKRITDVLLLYNMNTVDGDLGIGGIY
ncbi:MAG: DHHW family protein [Clostridium sp.]|nr:DHHW family protein [Clostridium sp.]